MRGTKLCEKIVEVPVDAPCWYHDRRFYFYVDITKGISLATDANAKCAKYLDYLQTPMKDSTNRTTYPSCSDFGAAAGECTSYAGGDRLIGTNGIPDYDRIEAMKLKCNNSLLGTAGTTQGARSSWDKFVRMKDNMDKLTDTHISLVLGHISKYDLDL